MGFEGNNKIKQRIVLPLFSSKGASGSKTLSSSSNGMFRSKTLSSSCNGMFRSKELAMCGEEECGEEKWHCLQKQGGVLNSHKQCTGTQVSARHAQARKGKIAAKKRAQTRHANAEKNCFRILIKRRHAAARNAPCSGIPLPRNSAMQNFHAHAKWKNCGHQGSTPRPWCLGPTPHYNSQLDSVCFTSSFHP